MLSHSRKAYSEAVHRQTTDEFLRCIENAFRHFGGAPRRLVLDNLKAAVKKADWFDPELNPKVRSFGEHYGCVFWPTRPRTPRHKGKVEKGVDYAQDNALKGRHFTSLEEQNAFLLNWELTVADTRIHGTTPSGRPAFRCCRAGGTGALALGPFPVVSRVPPHSFTATATSRSIGPTSGAAGILSARSLGAVGQPPGADFQRPDGADRPPPQAGARPLQHPPQFIASKKISGVERGTAWLLARVTSRIGPRSTTWAEAVIQARGVESVRVLMGLLSLAGRHPATAIEQACEIAQGYGEYHLRTIRALLQRQASKQDLLPFLSEHPMIRPMSEYSQFVHDAFQFRNEKTKP